MNVHDTRHHLAHHSRHLAVCAVAAVLVVAGLALGAPVLSIIGAAACGGMMLMMVWMMVGTAVKHRRHGSS